MKKKNKDKKEEVNIVRIQKNEQKENTYNIDSNLVSNNKKETTHSTSPITSLFRNSRRFSRWSYGYYSWYCLVV